MKQKSKIYKSEGAAANAAFQKKLERVRKRCNEYHKALEDRKEYVRQTYQFIRMLLEQKKVTKEELSTFYKGKKKRNHE